MSDNPLSDSACAIAIVDTETGGLDPATDPLLQVAVVHADIRPNGGLSITHEWSSLVGLRPPWRPIGAQHIHGIGRPALLLAPSERRVMPRVADLISGRTLVAHNLDFDRSFLDAAANRNGISITPDGEVCTLALSRSTDPERHLSHRLGDIAERHGVELRGAHHALNDARATAEVLGRLIASDPSLWPFGHRMS
ncbi:MAG: exonuclease domain-containing protein [Ilumatobacteraceae bacterium]|nr:3'-5' exonuclease [Actinomycetota bacterium]